jgi:hypothetical protein
MKAIYSYTITMIYPGNLKSNFVAYCEQKHEMPELIAFIDTNTPRVNKSIGHTIKETQVDTFNDDFTGVLIIKSEDKEK